MNLTKLTIEELEQLKAEAIAIAEETEVDFSDHLEGSRDLLGEIYNELLDRQ